MRNNVIRHVSATVFLLAGTLASGCSSGDGGGGGGSTSPLGRDVLWECAYHDGAPSHDYCTCDESAQGTRDAKCPASEYACCYAMEDALVDGGWVARCECKVNTGAAATQCEDLRTNPTYYEDDEYTRKFTMVPSCAF